VSQVFPPNVSDQLEPCPTRVMTNTHPNRQVQPPGLRRNRYTRVELSSRVGGTRQSRARSTVTWGWKDEGAKRDRKENHFDNSV
jgi:hypothetical protein